MPYIKQADRKRYDEYIHLLAMRLREDGPPSEGHLNYIITRLLLGAYDIPHSLSYHTLNTIRGILGCVWSEFYARLGQPYERRKCKENGDVYR